MNVTLSRISVSRLREEIPALEFRPEWCNTPFLKLSCQGYWPRCFRVRRTDSNFGHRRQKQTNFGGQICSRYHVERRIKKYIKQGAQIPGTWSPWRLNFVQQLSQFGRPRRRWEDNIKMYLQEVGCGGMDWMELAQDRDR